MAGAIVKRERKRIMRQDLLNDLGHPGKYASNVQNLRDGAQQLGGSISKKRTA